MLLFRDLDESCPRGSFVVYADARLSGATNPRASSPTTAKRPEPVARVFCFPVPSGVGGGWQHFGMTHPRIAQVVLDTTDARQLAEFYREMFGLHYREGDEPPPAGEPDRDWL